MKSIDRQTDRQTDIQTDRLLWQEIDERHTYGNLKCPNYEAIHKGGQKDRQIPDKTDKTDRQAKNNGMVRLPSRWRDRDTVVIWQK